MRVSKSMLSIIGVWLALAVWVLLVPSAAFANSNNVELLQSGHELVDGKMMVTADVCVKYEENVSLLVVGYDAEGEIIEIKKEDHFIAGGQTKAIQLPMEHGEELQKVDVRALGSITEPYKVLEETTVAKRDQMEAVAAVKNGGKPQLINVVATAYNANGKVVEVRGTSNYVVENRVSIFKIHLDAVHEIDEVKFTVLTDDRTYLVDSGTYMKDGQLVFTSVVKNGDQPQKLTARATPYSADGRELSIQTAADFIEANRLFNHRLTIKDSNATRVAAKYYDETGKQEIEKRGTLVTVNGKGVAMEQSPVNLEGNVVVPIRAITEAMGAGLEWEQETRSVTVTRGNRVIKLQNGSEIAYVDGQEITLAVPPQIINNHTMVPVRFISEALGAQVFWDQNSQTVLIVR